MASKKKNSNKNVDMPPMAEQQKLRQKLQKLFKTDNKKPASTPLHPPKMNDRKTVVNENVARKRSLPEKEASNKSLTVEKKAKTVPKVTPKEVKGKASKVNQERMQLAVPSTINTSFTDDDDDYDFLPYFAGEEDDVSDSDTYTMSEDDDDDDDDSYSIYTDDDDDDDEYSIMSDSDSYRRRADDVIIHQGTAVKRALKPDDGDIPFESDNEDAQIVELAQKQVTTEKKEMSPPCPQLVPIQDKTEMMTDNDSEITFSDDCSYVSEDICDKYKNLDDFDDCNHISVKMKATVITAVGHVKFTTTLPDTPNTKVSGRMQEDSTPTYKMAQHSQLDEKNNSVCIITSSELVNDDAIVEKQRNRARENEAAIVEKDPNIPCENEAAIVEKEANIACENDAPIVEEQPENSLLIDKPIQKVPRARPTGTRLFNSKISRYVLVLLKAPVYFYGTIRFKVLAGLVDVYGFRAPVNQEFELFSPRGCSCVSLEPRHSTDSNLPTFDKICEQLKEYFSKDILTELSANYVPQHDALVLLRPNDERSHMIDHFRCHMNENVFPNIQIGAKKSAQQLLEFKLKCCINEESTQALKMPSQWQDINLGDNDKLRLLLVGGKSVGKSTLLRYLLNRLMNVSDKGVLVIDLDVGQSEIGLPQTVNCLLMHQPLLGPGFFYTHKPDCSYLVGQVNITLCAQRYLHAVRLLLEFCRKKPEYAGVPWLINTMGYNQGIGMELIAAISEELHPTDVIQITSRVAINNFPCALQTSALCALPRELFDVDVNIMNLGMELPKYKVPEFRWHNLRSAVSQESRYQREWNMSAKDYRYASMLAQMSDILSDDLTHFTERIPYCAALANIRVISLSDPYRTEHELHQALTANVVFLCHKATEGRIASEPMKCFGIGIVRCLDAENIYMLPAEAIVGDNLSKVNCLVLSEQPLPTGTIKLQTVRFKNTWLPFVYTTENNASTAVRQIWHRSPRFLNGNHKKIEN